MAQQNLSFLGVDMIEIFVGPEHKQYYVHKEPLCKQSQFFSTMFKDNFKEGVTKECHLTDEEPEVFDYIIRCVYAGDVPSTCEHMMSFINADETTVDLTTEKPTSLFLRVYRSLDQYMFIDLQQKLTLAFEYLRDNHSDMQWLAQRLPDRDIRFAMLNFDSQDYLLRNVLESAVFNYCAYTDRGDHWMTLMMEDVPTKTVVLFCNLLKERCRNYTPAENRIKVEIRDREEMARDREEAARDRKRQRRVTSSED